MRYTVTQPGNRTITLGGKAYRNGDQFDAPQEIGAPLVASGACVPAFGSAPFEPPNAAAYATEDEALRAIAGVEVAVVRPPVVDVEPGPAPATDEAEGGVYGVEDVSYDDFPAVPDEGASKQELIDFAATVGCELKSKDKRTRASVRAALDAFME